MLLSILSADVPIVSASERVKIEDLGQDFYRVIVYNGFMQRPNVPEIMKLASNLGLPIDEAETTYYVGRVSLWNSREVWIHYPRFGKPGWAVRFNPVVAPFELFGSAVKPDFPSVRKLKYIKPLRRWQCTVQ